MSKKVIRNAAAIGLGTLILGVILLLATGANFLTIIFMLVCFVSGAISYFGALVKAAQLRKVNWFVGVLLTGVIGALIFGLFGPEKRTSDQALPGFMYDSYKQTKRSLDIQ